MLHRKEKLNTPNGNKAEEKGENKCDTSDAGGHIEYHNRKIPKVQNNFTINPNVMMSNLDSRQ